MENAAVGSKPKDPAWVKQKGQCSECVAVPAGADGLAGARLSEALPVTLIDLRPATEHISNSEIVELVLAANA